MRNDEENFRKGGSNMFSKKHHELLTRAMCMMVGILFLGVLGPRVTLAASVSELTAQAKKEGAMNATITSSVKGKTIAKLSAAFKKRFGLNDIKVTIAPVGDTRHYPKAAVATRAGGRPTYDAITGSGLNNIMLMGLGGVQKIDSWQALLKEMHPLVNSGKVQARQISPTPYTGLAFQNYSRIWSLAYNPKLISKKELPKTHAELGDPKYKGKFVQPPFSANWDIGILVFPDISKEKWLEVVRKAGRNAGGVGFPAANMQRLLIGEYAFSLSTTSDYMRIKSKDPDAPVGVSYFTDYNSVSAAYYVVRKRARHPAAGTLFALWMTTPEAEAIWQPDIFRPQFPWGQSEMDRKIRQYLRENNAEGTDFLASDRGVKLLKWYGTPEGRGYRSSLGRAIRGR
jgi:hypothetical protein